VTAIRIRLWVEGVLLDDQRVVLGVGARDLIGELGAVHADACRGAMAYMVEFVFPDGDHIRWGTDVRGMVTPIPVDDLAAAIARHIDAYPSPHGPA
jgi:hypothetical protein